MKTEYDLLFSACECAVKSKIKLVRPPPSTEETDAEGFLKKIAEASDIRIRKVTLTGEWWRKDCGPLLAFYKNKPCALLPKKKGGYKLVRFDENRTLKMSAALSNSLSKQAYYFYPSLPTHLNRFRDILDFSWPVIKADFEAFMGIQTLMSLLTLVVPVVIAYLFNTVIPNADFSMLKQLALLLLVNIIIMTLFGITQAVALMRLRFKLEMTTAPAIWDRILKFPLQVFRRFSAGDLAFRAEIVTDIQNTVAQSALLFLANAFSVILLVLLLFYYNAALALMALGLILLIGAVTVFSARRQIFFMRRLYFQFGKYAGFIFEVLSGVVKIRVADAARRVFRLWWDRSLKRNETEASLRKIFSRLEVFSAVMLAVIPAMLYGLVALQKNPMPFGDFIAFNAAYSLCFFLLLKMNADLGNIIRVAPLWEKAKPMIAAKIESGVDQVDPGELTGEIELRDIMFRYHRHDRPLFKEFSLTIQPGEFIAIVGPSGSGKSSLFRLLLGFEEPEAGAVLYNGMNLKMLKPVSVRRQIGVVIQNSALIPGTIFENIVGHSRELTRLDAWEVAGKVGLTDIIKSLPMQMDTLIMESAITLSGGEVQRLLLARALAQKPRILFLDEATSALDNTTQAVVHHYLKQLQATQIIAAHRLSTIVHADRIIVLNKGAIVQIGSFDELISAPGLFSQLARRQL